MLTKDPTGSFTILESQGPVIDGLYFVRKCQSTGFEAQKLQKRRLGRIFFFLCFDIHSTISWPINRKNVTNRRLPLVAAFPDPFFHNFVSLKFADRCLRATYNL